MSENKDIKTYKYILIGVIILLALIVFKEMRPYVSSFLGASTLYVLLRGQMVYLVERKRWKKSLASTILVFEALLFFLIPLTAFSIMMVDSMSNIKIDPEEILKNFNEWIAIIESKIGYDIITPENLSFLPQIGSTTVQFLASNIYSMLINSIFLMFILYYMFYNYEGFERGFKEILPFKEENKMILGQETKMIIQANAIGIPLLAIIQGGVAFIGYAFLGVEQPLLYAVLTAFSTVIPIVGTMIIWIPLSVMLFVSGDTTNGIILFLYGLLIVGSVDNLARFLLQKQLADIHPLITIFGVMIGIPMFGFWGVIFGPLLLSLLLLFYNMFRHEYISGSQAEPRITTKFKTRKIKVPRTISRNNAK